MKEKPVKKGEMFECCDCGLSFTALNDANISIVCCCGDYMKKLKR